MSWLDELELELRRTGMPVARRRRIVAEFADHLAFDPGSEERLGSPAALARQFADEVGTGNTSVLHSIPGEVRPAAGAGLVLLATFILCLWVGTYQEFAPVGLIGARYTPYWAVPVAVAVGVGGAPLAHLIYRGTILPTDRRGWLLLWGLLSSLVMFAHYGPWLKQGFQDDGGLQHGDGGLVLVVAVVGAAVLVALRQRRSAGVAALIAGLVGLGITLYAGTHLNSLIPPYGRTNRVRFGGIADAGWGLDLALLASLSLALCGLVWLLVLADPQADVQGDSPSGPNVLGR